MIKLRYILIPAITISMLQAADNNQLQAPHIPKHMSLTTLSRIGYQADDLELRAKEAFSERTAELLSRPASEITIEELEMLERLLTQIQQAKTKNDERTCCAAVAVIGMGGLLTYKALHEDIPSLYIFNTAGASCVDPHQLCLTEEVSSINLNPFCLAIGVGSALIGIIQSAKIIMQPTIKHKIEELQQIIREKKEKLE